MINNYFLHFAGSWYEGDMWKTSKVGDLFDINFKKKLNEYKKLKLRGKPMGRISPKKT